MPVSIVSTHGSAMGLSIATIATVRQYVAVIRLTTNTTREMTTTTITPFLKKLKAKGRLPALY